MSNPPAIRQVYSQNTASITDMFVDESANRIALLGHRNAGLSALTGQRISGLVTLLEGTNGQILHEIPLGFELVFHTYDRQRHHLYVQHANNPVYTGSIEGEPPGYITQIDLITGQVMGTYCIGPRLGGLYYCEPHDKLYFTYYNTNNGGYMMSVLDEHSHEIRDIAQISWQPNILHYLPETQEMLLTGNHHLASLDASGHITIRYQIQQPGGGIIYRGQVENVLYFTGTSYQGGTANGDMLFALTLPAYQAHAVMNIDSLFFEWIDPARTLVYFLSQGVKAPTLITCSLANGAPQLHPIATLNVFPNLNDTLLFDSIEQRWFFDASARMIDENVIHQLGVIDLPALRQRQASAVKTIALDELVVGLSFFANHRQVLVATSGYAQGKVMFFEIG